MKMILNMNNERTILFQIQDLYTRASLCKNYFYPATIKSYNVYVARRQMCATQTELTTPSD